MDTLQLTVLDGIDRAVRDFGGNPALQTDGRTISYREFGELTDAFAQRLELRTAPGEFVGILATRGIGAIVAMVGALKARRPFVFVDGRDSATTNGDKTTLLGVRLIAGPAKDDGTVDLSDVPVQWRTDRSARPVHGFADGELAYAIQTSGSTGKPKCVLVRTAPLAAVIADHVRRLEVGPASATLQFARLTFDGCITEILWTLTAAARLVVLDESRLAPGAVLRQTLEDFRITHLKTTPFALTVTEPSGDLSLRHVINGGGACRPSVVRRWTAVTVFHNAYGLTETTVCNLLTPPLDPEECGESVPLGEIVGDCAYHLRGGSPDRGELVITGPSVAAGYLTEEGVSPFSATEGYPTGDVVERRDGRLYFVERVDRQVKVRGYRIDPGEVETAVCRIPEVRDAVVVAEAHDAGKTADPDALVCYYQGDIEPRELRERVDGTIDPYKVPSVFERVHSFPHTPNGKVDRDALAALRRQAHTTDAADTPAEALVRLVAALTGTADVTLDDDFFDVGGDSASAVVLVTKLRGLGWLDAGVRDVLRAETLRDLADQLEKVA